MNRAEIEAILDNMYHINGAEETDEANALLLAEYDRLAANTTVADLIAKFPQGVQVKIYPVFPGEYSVGYSDSKYTYVPGMGSYYTLSEALEKCLAALEENKEREKGKSNNG